jgi:hypothetical protein
MRYVKLCCRVSNETLIARTSNTDEEIEFAIGLYNDQFENEDDFAEYIGDFLEKELIDFEVINIESIFTY